MKQKPLHRDEKADNTDTPCSLILYNDDINTFDHVILSLVEVCGHDPLQAEQCALLVHFKGSCEVKQGSYRLLKSMSKSLNSKGLRTEVS